MANYKTMNCKICQSGVTSFYKGKVLNKYEVNYFRCNVCGFIQTEDPYWLKEAYSDAIAQLDIGLLDRNISFSEMVEKLILSFYPDSNYCLDYGGGYGLFVRRMRDKGFSFYRDDIYCENIFAKHFDIKDASVKKFDIVTAFEVFEHLRDPLADIGKMLELGNNIFFSTILPPETAKAFDEWWYRAPLSGQHIAFYTMESLKTIAKKFDKKLYSNETNFHILSTIEIDENKIRKIFSPVSESRIRKIIKILTGENELNRRKSLVESDYKMIEQIVLKRTK
jgi:2-polyprenyl-3-methyl-5-hydroxy-6-metoxy-1,4-benzoquinol methylase